MIIDTAGREHENNNVSVRNAYGFELDSPAEFQISELRQFANKRSRESTHAKKELFIWPTSPILIPPIIREGNSPIDSYLLRIAKGFFDKVYSDSHALIDSLAICTKNLSRIHTHIRIQNTRMYRVLFLSTPNKRATEALLSPFLTYRWQCYNRRYLVDRYLSKYNRIILSRNIKLFKFIYFL